MKVYLSGPMTGKEDFNRAAFKAAELELTDFGFAVTNPHELPSPVLTGDEEYDWRQFLARDIAELLTGGYDGVVVLPDWEQSRGAGLEVRVAQYLGLPVYPLAALLEADKQLNEDGGK